MPDLIATAAFGLEAVVSRELEKLGYADRVVEDGRVTFAADHAAIARTNLWLRSADRVLVELGQFNASEFGALFDGVVALPWEEWLDRSAAIPVEVRAVRSPIVSPRSAQSIVKKAIVTRLCQVYGVTSLPENGPTYLVDVSIRGTDVSVAIDTSGAGLHKRGYRTERAAAPLKETLAAGILQLTYWKRDRPLADPFCGSGTIPIEAALMAGNIAPGLRRSFVAEQWPLLNSLDSRIWRAAREEAHDLRDLTPNDLIWGSDQDARVLGRARRHAQNAGVSDRIHWQTATFQSFRSNREFGCMVTNPPYGERLEDLARVEQLYAQMPEILHALSSWSFYILTSHPNFANFARRKPDRRRKLYNGKISCTLYQFYGPRPPKPQHGAPPSGHGVDVPIKASDDT